MKIKKFNEGNINNNVIIVKPKELTYFELLPLLKGLESERPGIKKRVWDFLTNENDIQFQPINGRILNINLYFYGIGDEYETEYLNKYPEELEHCKITHPEAFVNRSDEYELRLDFNLILSIYEKHIDDIEVFSVLINW